MVGLWVTILVALIALFGVAAQPNMNPSLLQAAIGLWLVVAVIVAVFTAYDLRRKGESGRRSKRLSELLASYPFLAGRAEALGEHEPSPAELTAQMLAWDADIRRFIGKEPHRLAAYDQGLNAIASDGPIGRDATLIWITERKVRLDRYSAAIGRT